MNCKEASQLLSEKMDRPLHTKEKISLGVHTTLCASCRKFGQQIKELRYISSHYAKGEKAKKK